jgi:hypothetical protein
VIGFGEITRGRTADIDAVPLRSTKESSTVFLAGAVGIAVILGAATLAST